jgi:hypothetical protein
MADNIQDNIAVPETYEKDGKRKQRGRPSGQPLAMTAAILPGTFPNTWPSRAEWSYSRRFQVASARDEFGDKFFIERNAGHKMIVLELGAKKMLWN